MAIFPAVMSVRAYIMGAGGLYMFYVFRKNNITFSKLGFTHKEMSTSLKELILPSLLMILTSLIIFALIPNNLIPALIGYDPQSISSLTLRILLYCLWSVPFQELLFRGYLYLFVSSVYKSPKSIAIVMWLVFVLAHIPFFSPMMMIIAMWMGYVYIKNYLKHHNLLPIMISHALVGGVLLIVRDFYLPYS